MAESIKTKIEYRKACARIAKLYKAWEKTPEGKEACALTNAVDDYEDEMGILSPYMRAMALLRELEWAGPEHQCPDCACVQKHAPGCRLKEAIDGQV